MIKLTLPPEPEELQGKKNELTQLYQTDKSKAVWRQDYIKNPLLEMTHNKCAYSEAPLGINGTYAEIDHFKPKEPYKDCVVEWGNLLPTCKHCNTQKRDHDVIKEPIINPIKDNPRDYLYVKAFRYRARENSPIGELTIEKLDLNNRVQFQDVRARIADAKRANLGYWLELLEATGTEKQKCAGRMLVLLRECGPASEYSAVVATYLLYECEEYKKIESRLKALNLWSEEHQTAKEILENIALPQ